MLIHCRAADRGDPTQGVHRHIPGWSQTMSSAQARTFVLGQPAPNSERLIVSQRVFAAFSQNGTMPADGFGLLLTSFSCTSAFPLGVKEDGDVLVAATRGLLPGPRFGERRKQGLGRDVAWSVGHWIPLMYGAMSDVLGRRKVQGEAFGDAERFWRPPPLRVGKPGEGGGFRIDGMTRARFRRVRTRGDSCSVATVPN